MTTFAQAAGLIPMPPSEVEWEDLLVRIEVMVRALRFVLDGLDPKRDDVSLILDELVEREDQVGRLLEEAYRSSSTGANGAAGSQPQVSAHAPQHQVAAPRDTGHTSALPASPERVERFIRTRSRNFAMVQRRGVEVWNWTMSANGVEISTFQLLGFLAQADVRVLAALRAAAGGRAPAC